MTTLQSLEKKIDSKFDFLSEKINIVSDNLDHLAIMMKESFDRCVTKDEFNKRMDGVDFRLDVIKNISIGGHERRIENLEDRMRVVDTKLKLN